MKSFENIKAKIKPHLVPDEKVLWCGAPSTKRMVIKSLPVAFIGLIFLFISLGHLFGLIKFEDGQPHNLVAFLFVITGIIATSTPVFEYFKARKTHYIITNFRIMIFHDTHAMDVENYFKEGVNAIKVKEKSTDYGDIIFREHLRDDPEGGGKIKDCVGLWGIKDLQKISRLITNLEGRVGSTENKLI